MIRRTPSALLGSRTLTTLALATASLAACNTSDIVDPSASRLSPNDRPSAASGVNTPTIAKVILVSDSGVDRKTWHTTVGKKVYFSALAYDAKGKVVPAATVTRIYRTTTTKLFTIDSTTGVGVASAQGSFSVTVTAGGVTSTQNFYADPSTTAGTSSAAAAGSTTPTPTPTPTATPTRVSSGTAPAATITLTVARFDGQSGPATVSSGIPLAPGALRPGQEDQVRVFVAGVEQPAYVRGLWSMHPDGSLRAVLVQFSAASLPATGTTGTLTIGTVRPEAMTLASTLVKAGAAAASTPAGIPQAAALPNSTSYLLSTDLVGPTVSSATAQGQGATYARYESDFVKYAEQAWARDGADWERANYYDRALIYYAMWARTGNVTYWARAGQLAADYRARYLAPNSYGASPHWAQLEGLEKHYLLTGDEASREAVVKTAGSLSTMIATAYLTATNGEGRIAARVLHAQLLAWRLTPAGAPAVAQVSGRGAIPTWGANVEAVLAKLVAWQKPDGSYPAVGQVCGGQLNYMVGQLNDALIKTYDYYVPSATPRASVQATARGLVTRAVDYLWATQWNAAKGAFAYASVDCTAKGVGGTGVAPDLNNLISAGFGWVYRQTGDAAYRTAGEAIFAGGVSQAYLQGSKQLNENYTSSFRYLGYR